MATLHVRNVPDQLYERLRERATANRRSIGAEIVVVLENELGITGVRPWRTMFSRRRTTPTTPFQHFTPAARNVVVEAKEEARGLGDGAVGTEHLLLALLWSPLTDVPLPYERARAAVEGVPRERADVPSDAGMPFTAGAKKAMELALRYCIQQRSAHIGPEHLMLGIALEEEGLGARILAEAGLDAATLRTASTVPDDLISHGFSVEMASGFRVLELKGTAEEWERGLNSYAARGYELVEIVSERAIFRTPTPER
jgi:Clp amino terminal domain, pathogenicity island component/Antitoxin FitA-like, ribbon-helix-helix